MTMSPTRMRWLSPSMKPRLHHASRSATQAGTSSGSKWSWASTQGSGRGRPCSWSCATASAQASRSSALRCTSKPGTRAVSLGNSAGRPRASSKATRLGRGASSARERNRSKKPISEDPSKQSIVHPERNLCLWDMEALDTLGRPIKALRISVTDRCNLRCTYCMPREVFGPDYPYLPRAALLRFEETARLVRIFAGLGVTKLRLTGGEPLLRRELPVLVRMVASVPGIEDMALTTNGVLLPELAAGLKAAGLSRLTVSLDTLRPDRFRAISDTRVAEA